eukprot:TRINITY_DN67913_c0_g1_i4.p1 TRINITY_DN67913_c0_g1~~TRINITY_DN67913_c0_g1_i4.p1  ORF type:complete len:119 (+),score=3.99 TRINITY_DN67913_c0_g1_i4:269-625(+)
MGEGLLWAAVGLCFARASFCLFSVPPCALLAAASRFSFFLAPLFSSIFCQSCAPPIMRIRGSDLRLVQQAHHYHCEMWHKSTCLRCWPASCSRWYIMFHVVLLAHFTTVCPGAMVLPL